MKRDYQNESNPILNHISFEMKNQNENETIQCGSFNEKLAMKFQRVYLGRLLTYDPI